MSLAEEMLATMPLSGDLPTYSGDEEPHIVINESRQAIVPNELKTIAVTGDKDIETVTFDCVRYWDGNDLSTFAIYLNYALPDLTTGTYIPEKITTTDGDEFYHFDWKIKNNITLKSGKISFAVTAVKTKQNESGETVVDKQWGSIPNGDCSIALGLGISNVPSEEESSDVVAQLSAILEQINLDIVDWVENVVVQTTGESETAVMSQKAVTEYVDGTNPTLYKGLFTRQTFTGDSHIFSNVSNRIAYPHAKIYNNDVVVKCENGYKFVVIIWRDNSLDPTAWVSTTPWNTENYTIPANTYFSILIAKSDDSDILTDDYNKVKLFRLIDNEFEEILEWANNTESRLNSLDGNAKEHMGFTSGNWSIAEDDSGSLILKRIEYDGRQATDRPYRFKNDVKISMPDYTHYSVFVNTITDIESMTLGEKSGWLTSGYFIVPANTYFVLTIRLNTDTYTIDDALNALQISVNDSLYDLCNRVEALENDTYGEILTKDETFAELFNNSGDAEPFLFFTDPHYVAVSENGGCRTGYEHHLDIIKKHYDDSSAGFVLCGGDWLNNSNTQANACYELSKIKGKMRALFDKFHLVLGNHDTNYQGTTVIGGEASTGQLTQQTIYNLWYGEHGKSYYSFNAAKTKFYVFDCGIDWNHGSAGMNDFDEEQVSYFLEQLNSNNDEYIALAPHMVYVSGTTVHPLTNRVTEIANIYNSRGTVENNGTTYDFSQKTGKVEFVIAGHLHEDSNGTLNGIPYIQTINADVSVNYPTFDFVIVDYTARIIKTVRIGTGEDREIALV